MNTFPRRHATWSKHILAALALPMLLTGCVGTSDVSSSSVNQQSNEVVTENANDKTAFDFFVGKGLTDVQAAGIVGNLDQESEMDPTIWQIGGGPGRGIAQWSAGERWDVSSQDNVKWYAGQKGEDIYSLNLQLEFIWYELTNIGYGYSQLRAATDVTSATLAFQDYYEICDACNPSNRIAHAQAALAAFGSGKGSSPCSHVPAADNGLYCGTSNQSGFSGGSATEIYNCQGGAVSGTTSCQFGCYTAPAGKDDGCYADPCTGVPASGNGIYCGSTRQGGFQGGSSRLLYNCSNGRTLSTSTCGGSCVVAPAGQADHC
jgi:hypothetical protein